MNEQRVMLVEDDPADAGLILTAIREAPFTCAVVHARDGADALRLLESADTLPDLILLDLNMPRMGGHELLRRLKASAMLADIPAVVLTTSDAETDIRASYRAGAAGYVTKPVDVDDLFTAVRRVQDYWFGLVRRPAR